MRKAITKWGPYVLLGLAFLLLVLLNLFYPDHWLDSDMSAEMIFSRLLSEEGHIFATPDWYYSTEFRFLYTHLVMGPLFRLSENWQGIRMAANLSSYLLMTASYFYMMKPFGGKKGPVILTSVILLLPFSETMMLHMEMGNTYPWHVILGFLFLGMYLRLVKREEYRRIRQWELAVCFVGLSLICGVSGVRYLLALQVPLVLAAFVYLLGAEEYRALRAEFRADGKNKGRLLRLFACERARYLYTALLGAAGGVAGYGLNVLWVSRRYIFQTYGGTNFISVYQGVLWERAQDAVGSLLMLFGYIPDRSVISLRGLVTLAAFVMIAVFGGCAVWAVRKSEGERLFAALFFWSALALNVFVFVFTTSTMVPRYYLTVFVFVLPALAFFLEREERLWDRLLAGVLLCLCLGLGPGKTILSYVTTDKNAERRDVAEFLEETYDFGYATYWNANIVTELTGGRVEVANILDPEGLQFFTWSTPKRYYEEGYHPGRVFLLLTEEEAERFADAKAVRNGQQVYADGAYVVYEYPDAEALLSCRPEEGQAQVR